MKKILFFIKVPPPVTGATLMNMRINESVLLRTNFDIQSICRSYSRNLHDLGKKELRKFFAFARYFTRLFIHLVFNKPKIVYYQLSPTNLAFIRDVLYVLLIKIFRTKIIYHIRGQGIKEQSKQRWRKRLYHFVFKDSDVICLSELLTYDIENVFKGSIHIVNNGLPEIEAKWFHQNQKTQNKIIELVFFSNLIISKGIIVFLETLDILNNRNIPFNAKIIGADGTITYKELEMIIRAKDLVEKIQYLGPLYNDEKYFELSKADVLVFPTNNDAFPGVLIEAMQVGLPVISTLEGAIPDIVDHNVTGFLVEKNSPNQIVEYVIEFIKKPYLIKEMGRAGHKKYVQKYTFDIFEQNMLNIFSQGFDDH